MPFHVLSYAYKNSDQENYRYSKSCLEVKYVFNKNKPNGLKNPIVYLGFRAFYFPQRYRLHNEFVWLDSAFYRYNYSDLKRNVWTFDLTNGYEFSIGRRFVYNTYFGFGVRILQLNQHPSNLEPGMMPTHAVEDLSSHIYRYIGTFYRPNLVSGIRIGYRLGKANKKLITSEK